jgi:hypothetical protein
VVELPGLSAAARIRFDAAMIAGEDINGRQIKRRRLREAEAEGNGQRRRRWRHKQKFHREKASLLFGSERDPAILH